MPEIKNLSRIHTSSHTLELILTYSVNIGLPTRMTPALMREAHSLQISRGTISDYANTAAILIKPFIGTFDYKPASRICGNETNIKIRSRRHYVYFVMDATVFNLIPLYQSRI